MTKMHWHPKTGEPQVFADHETPPEGYLDHHPRDTDKEAEPGEKTAVKPMTKAELADALKGGGITFPLDAKRDELEVLLIDGLRKHLTGRGINYADSDDVRKLLELASAR